MARGSPLAWHLVDRDSRIFRTPCGPRARSVSAGHPVEPPFWIVLPERWDRDSSCWMWPCPAASWGRWWPRSGMAWPSFRGGVSRHTHLLAAVRLNSRRGRSGLLLFLAARPTAPDPDLLDLGGGEATLTSRGSPLPVLLGLLPLLSFFRSAERTPLERGTYHWVPLGAGQRWRMVGAVPLCGAIGGGGRGIRFLGLVVPHSSGSWRTGPSLLSPEVRSWGPAPRHGDLFARTVAIPPQTPLG